MSRLVNPGGEHDHRTVVLLDEPSGLEPVVHDRHQVLVLALTHQVVVGEQHPESSVHQVEVVGRHVDEALPDRDRVGVPLLEQDHPVAGAVGERLVLVELRVGGLVEAVEIALAHSLGGDVLADVEEVLDQHPERTPPVADVVLADHLVAHELQHPDERVADHRGAEVTGVHLLGDIRRRVVDHDPLLLGVRFDAEAIVAGDGGELCSEPLGREGDVDEPRSGHLELARHAVQRAGVDHPLGDLARVGADRLGQRQSAVDLGVGTVARAHRGVRGSTGDLGEHRCEQRGDGGNRVGHQPHSLARHDDHRDGSTVGGWLGGRNERRTPLRQAPR